MDFKQILMATSLYDWLGKRTYAQSGEDVIAWGELKELKESRTQEIKVPAGPGLADSIGGGCDRVGGAKRTQGIKNSRNQGTCRARPCRLGTSKAWP